MCQEKLSNNRCGSTKFELEGVHCKEISGLYLH